MREFDFEIDNKYENREIKWFLENVLNCSSNIISKLKQDNYILLNGKPVTVREKLSLKDNLKIIIPTNKSNNILPNAAVKFKVLYEDEDILVVDKPSGIPTHPSHNHYIDTLANGVCAYVKDKDFVFHAINRLDRETSGVVIVAKNMLSAHILSEQIKRRQAEKIYYAITVGIPDDEGVIDAPIAREKDTIIKRCISTDGKEAKTEYKVLKKNENHALVLVKPLTGRTHQIRVHFAHIGCHLYGDGLYGDKDDNGRVRLHCKKITFFHPLSQKEMEVESDLPEDFTII